MTNKSAKSKIMAFDHPNFMLQFDNESLPDQDTCYTSSHENVSSKTTGQKLEEDYKAKGVKTSFNTGKTSRQLAYSSTKSQATGNAVSRPGSNSNEACEEEDDSMDQMPSIHDSEITKYANYSEVLQDMVQQTKVVLMQYSEVLSDSETYEQQAFQAITDLTAHAQLLLQNVNDKKKILCRRISSISEELRSES